MLNQTRPRHEITGASVLTGLFLLLEDLTLSIFHNPIAIAIWIIIAILNGLTVFAIKTTRGKIIRLGESIVLVMAVAAFAKFPSFWPIIAIVGFAVIAGGLIFGFVSYRKAMRRGELD